MTVDAEPLVGRLRAAGCVYAEDEAAVLVEAAGGPAELERMCAAREAGTPLEQVVGWAEFRGLRLRVAPGCFVPRARTGLLVELALPLLRPGAVVVDLCCGVGALGAALLVAEPSLDLHACDLDPAAIGAARRNLDPAVVHAGDLYDALPRRLRGRVDVVVCNAPYVPTAAIATMPLEARDHEHRLALDGGPDGLDVHRRVAAGIGEWLAPDGVLVIETSRVQSTVTAGLLDATGLQVRVAHDDGVEACAVLAKR